MEKEKILNELKELIDTPYDEKKIEEIIEKLTGETVKLEVISTGTMSHPYGTYVLNMELDYIVVNTYWGSEDFRASYGDEIIKWVEVKEKNPFTPISEKIKKESQQVLEEALDLADKYAPSDFVSLPEVEVGELYLLSDVWDGEGDMPEEDIDSWAYWVPDPSVSYSVHLNYIWERVYDPALQIKSDRGYDFTVRLLEIEWC